MREYNAELRPLRVWLEDELSNAGITGEDLINARASYHTSIQKPSVIGNAVAGKVALDDLIYSANLPHNKVGHLLKLFGRYLDNLSSKLGKDVPDLVLPFSAYNDSPRNRLLDWLLPNPRYAKPFAPIQAVAILVRVLASSLPGKDAQIIKAADDFYIDYPQVGEVGIKNAKAVGLDLKWALPALQHNLAVLLREPVDFHCSGLPGQPFMLCCVLRERAAKISNLKAAESAVQILRFLSENIFTEAFWKRIEKKSASARERSRIEQRIREFESTRQLAVERALAGPMLGPEMLAHFERELSDILVPVVLSVTEFRNQIGNPYHHRRRPYSNSELKNLAQRIDLAVQEKLQSMEAELAK